MRAFHYKITYSTPYNDEHTIELMFDGFNICHIIGPHRRFICRIDKLLYSEENDFYYFLNFAIYWRGGTIDKAIDGFIKKLLEEKPEFLPYARSNSFPSVKLCYFKSFIVGLINDYPDTYRVAFIVDGHVKLNFDYLSYCGEKTLVFPIITDKTEQIVSLLENNAQYLTDVEYDKNHITVTDLSTDCAVNLKPDNVTLNDCMCYALTESVYFNAKPKTAFKTVHINRNSYGIHDIITKWLANREGET